MQKRILYPLVLSGLLLISGCNSNRSSASIDDKKNYIVSYYSEDGNLLYEDNVKKERHLYI